MNEEEKKKISITLYRHKEYKDFYLIRNWSICGGGENTDFYTVTKSLREAINNMFHYNSKIKKDELANDFMYWNQSFGDKLKVKTILEKEIEFEGYTGTLKKEIKLKVCDFEPFYLEEK